jgi:hypothetical protein
MVEQALVHIPIYTFKYQYANQAYTALVEGGSGGVIANLFPAKAEAPYQLAGGLTALVFLGLATLPVLGGLIGGQDGATFGLLACAGLGLPSAAAAFAFAVWVAAKV